MYSVLLICLSYFFSRQETTFSFGGDDVVGKYCVADGLMSSVEIVSRNCVADLIVVGVSIADGVIVVSVPVFCSRRRR